MIGIIGGTGNVGSTLVRLLAEAGEDVVALSRRGGGSTPRIRHVAADLAEPPRVTEALRGAQAVFVMVSGAAHQLDMSSIANAVAQTGARRIVALSSIGARSRPTAASHEPLRQLEAAVKRTELAWTILQPGGFASNSMSWIPGVLARKTVAAPFGDVGIPIVDPDDIAAVAAAALRDERHAGATYELSGPELITPREQTKALTEALGVPLKFVELTRAQASDAWRAFMPPPVIETTLDAIGTPNEIELRISGDIERVLGRPARSFADWARSHAAAFRG